MSKRPKTVTEKMYVVIKKSDEPLSRVALMLKLKMSHYTIDLHVRKLLAIGCIEEMPSYYADMLALEAGLEINGRKVTFYRVPKDHLCEFCEVF